MVMAFVGEIDAVMEDIAAEIPDDDKLMQMYDRLRPLLDMSFEDYTLNAEGLLDFAAWLIEIYGKYGEGAFTDADATGVKKELLLRIGNLLNLSEQAVAAKQFVLQMFAQNMFDVLPNAKDPNYADYYAARKDLPNSAAAFVSRYLGSGFVPESDRAAEAGALFAMFDFSDALDVAEAFARHPLFGADAVLETMDEYLYINGINLLGKQLASSDKAAEAYRALDEMLRNCENVSWDQELSFSDQAQEYLIKDIGLSDSFSGTFTSMILTGEDGKIYIIPEDLIDELAGLDKLDANTIQKYGLKPFEGFTMPDGSGEGSFGGSITILPDGSISGSVGGLPEGSIGGSNGDSFIVVGPNFQFGTN